VVSIEVPLGELAGSLADYPWGYLVTVADGGQARLLAVPTRFEDGRLVAPAGEGTRANATARSQVTMVFPPADGRGHSLIVDGTATVSDDAVHVTPTWAVMHRPALAD
jgi:hypothetical protein